MILMLLILQCASARNAPSRSQKKCTAESCNAICIGEILEWESTFQRKAGMYRRNRCICEVSRKYDEMILGVSFIREFLERFPWSRIWYECIDNTCFLEPQYH